MKPETNPVLHEAAAPEQVLHRDIPLTRDMGVRAAGSLSAATRR
jgi:hypothetical protein